MKTKLPPIRGALLIEGKPVLATVKEIQQALQLRVDRMAQMQKGA